MRLLLKLPALFVVIFAGVVFVGIGWDPLVIEEGRIYAMIFRVLGFAMLLHPAGQLIAPLMPAKFVAELKVMRHIQRRASRWSHHALRCSKEAHAELTAGPKDATWPRPLRGLVKLIYRTYIAASTSIVVVGLTFIVVAAVAVARDADFDIRLDLGALVLVVALTLALLQLLISFHQNTVGRLLDELHFQTVTGRIPSEEGERLFIAIEALARRSIYPDSLEDIKRLSFMSRRITSAEWRRPE